MASQTVFVCLTYSLLQIHLLQQGHEELNRRTWPTTRRLQHEAPGLPPDRPAGS